MKQENDSASTTSAERTQIPEGQLIEGRWYVGRGRNSNVALWTRVGKHLRSPVAPGRLTFVTLGSSFGQPTIKDEGYYGEDSGCFQPFALIEEGQTVESVGTKPGWDRHYAKVVRL